MRKSSYHSPVGKLVIVSEGELLRGIWFADQRYFGSFYTLESIPEEETASIRSAKEWLDAYFSGNQPSIFELTLAPEGTPFRQKVWRILLEIPYGQTMTYKEIGQRIAYQEGKSSFSAQAVGGAVGHNPLSIVVPCHRVLGTNGSLTGYAGGLNRKQYLLDLEQRC